MENAETDCRAILKALSRYLDGETAGLDCASIEAHLERCGPCIERAGFERELKELIRRKCCESPPAGLADRIRAALPDDA